MLRIIAIFLLALPVVAAVCTGKDPCAACKDCSQCRYCSPKNPKGGSCGCCRNQTAEQARKRLEKQ